jgi:hypothetical protein
MTGTTPDPIAPFGIFNSAASYHAAAELLLAGAPGSPHTDAPLVALYYHAVELYLKAFIRLHGTSESHLRALGQNFRKLRAKAVEHGLPLSERDRGVLEAMAHSELWSRTRYLDVGAARRPDIRAVSDFCRRLEELVGHAMAASGYPVRPRGEARRCQLTLRPIPDRSPVQQQKSPDYQVMHAGLRVGRIYRQDAATGPEREWFWAIDGVHAGPDVMQTTGLAGSLDEAKGALRANWEKWLAWAKLADA